MKKSIEEKAKEIIRKYSIKYASEHIKTKEKGDWLIPYKAPTKADTEFIITNKVLLVSIVKEQEQKAKELKEIKYNDDLKHELSFTPIYIDIYNTTKFECYNMYNEHKEKHIKKIYDFDRPVITKILQFLNSDFYKKTPTENTFLLADICERTDFNWGDYSSTSYWYMIKISDLEKAIDNLNQLKAEYDNKIEQEKELKRIEKKKEEKELQNNIDNELPISGLQTYIRKTYEMIHSLNLIVTDNKARLFTTYFQKEIGGKTTYEFKEELKSLGFKWNVDKKVWEIEYTIEKEEMLINIVKKYNVKDNPYKHGYKGKCWECGCWSKKLDSDGYCGC